MNTDNFEEKCPLPENNPKRFKPFQKIKQTYSEFINSNTNESKRISACIERFDIFFESNDTGSFELPEGFGRSVASVIYSCKKYKRILYFTKNFCEGERVKINIECLFPNEANILVVRNSEKEKLLEEIESLELHSELPLFVIVNMGKCEFLKNIKFDMKILDFCHMLIQHNEHWAYESREYKDFETWNESTTVKYNNVSIGEFQIHKKRDAVKFRFILENLKKSFMGCFDEFK